jgi:hypothetical protein
MKIQERLRFQQGHEDSHLPGLRMVLVNPDGPAAADYIDNALDHIGHIVALAYKHIEDDDVREELRRRAYAALRGTP